MIKAFGTQWVLLSVGWFLLRNQQFEWALFPLAFWIFYMIMTVLTFNEKEFEWMVSSRYIAMIISFIAVLIFFISLRQIFTSSFFALVNYLSLVTVALCHCIFFYQVLHHKRR
ncbi:MAG: hypothetical protein Q4P28_06050 [Tissierellia bacterium]|nr:hypothetical protein [Tissierellia bacterium]